MLFRLACTGAVKGQRQGLGCRCHSWLDQWSVDGCRHRIVGIVGMGVGCRTNRVAMGLQDTMVIMGLQSLRIVMAQEECKVAWHESLGCDTCAIRFASEPIARQYLGARDIIGVVVVAARGWLSVTHFIDIHHVQVRVRVRCLCRGCRRLGCWQKCGHILRGRRNRMVLFAGGAGGVGVVQAEALFAHEDLGAMNMVKELSPRDIGRCLVICRRHGLVMG
ncbi:uncharacterized protein BJ171DRAFT_528194 [Polychytrium aggregatum]|uniref:uncharacterized protein n=1 Tax=Polychytrium aggregatum TaxID=110093 RepID=UPI0022FE5C19|nr:uncharacterized protein BJ171DRAFT_528194 [Polychytrium aggregatum]KAI9193388.1 hypothetical protein BJ171DRAFT_528194 [Polychytrium aggregatum]